MRLSSLARVRKSPLAVSAAAAPAAMRTVPPPTLGWNARDALAAMKPGYAIALDNIFPTTSDVRLRNGSATHCPGMGGPVETLMVYSGGATADKLFAISAGDLYDVSSGTLGSALASGLTNSRWQHVNYSTSGNHFIPAVNGADPLLLYDGTTWRSVTTSSSPYAITGVDTSTLAGVFVYAARLFFVPKSGLQAWYLDVDSIAGAATVLDLGPECVKGGYLVAGGTWARDGGDGMYDLCVFVTSHGEAIIYSGLDPSDPTNWSKVGRYDIPAPIGRRCLLRGGSDLLIITIAGVISLSTILSLDPSQSAKASVSDNVRSAFTNSAALYKSSFGWEGIAYPASSMALFNIPVAENTTQYQYVVNTITGAWCRFIGWNANCWALFNEQIYFGDNDGNVVLADTGDNDNGTPIDWLLHTAYWTDSPGLNSHYTMTKPIVAALGELQYGIAVLTDYSTDYTGIQSVAESASSTGAWDTSTWDETAWQTLQILRDWYATPAIGQAASIAMKGSASGTAMSVDQFSLMLQRGGPL